VEEVRVILWILFIPELYYWKAWHSNHQTYSRHGDI